MSEALVSSFSPQSHNRMTALPRVDMMRTTSSYDDDEATMQIMQHEQLINQYTTTPQSSAYQQIASPPFTHVSIEFECYLAEGSPMCYVSNFSSMVELYEQIAQCFDISANEIMYCTLNTAKADMDRILSGQIGLEDTIYVHRKGNRKQIEVKKTENFLGLTIADNSNGCSYIKKIKEDSTASRVPFIKVGDHIESIMEQNMVGFRHYEVAGYLKNIPLEQNFTLTLIEPICSNIEQLNQPVRNGKSCHSAKKSHNGKGTLRIRGSKVLEIRNDVDDVNCNHVDDDHDSHCIQVNASACVASEASKICTALKHINKQLEMFIGINDDELAEVLWRLAAERNPHEFLRSVTESELNEFKFSQNFIFDVWAIVNDIQHGRVPR